MDDELENYRAKIASGNYPEFVAEKLSQELRRLAHAGNFSAESAVLRDYIERVLELPWNNKTKENSSLTHAEEILEKDHYGIAKVKERIVEFLAVRQNSSDLDAPIICLAGPPGVGKTSIAKSIARALNRKYVRMSLGGVRDESEIRGHRKTYVGAMPGRLIEAIRQAGALNPLILMDEIDKMSSDFRGNPASALLEALDAEQNNTFRDHYLELPFDLSDALFICTANQVENVPQPLMDRLEIIQLASYTEDEKLHIALDFLVPKQLKKHGLKKSQIRFQNEAINHIIRFYTREAGVRQLERMIATICRKAVKTLLIEERKSVNVTADNLETHLGKKKFRSQIKNGQPEVGVCRGLAWTSVGGDTLSIEVNTMKGTGKFKLTGNIGKVMEESALAAISYIRAQHEQLSIRKGFYKDTDIHIHIPEGATPKDGPSAGITMATAMVSALTDTPVSNQVAMTGEITIRGRVLPIGGLKEKILAAKSAGIQKVLLPWDNESDLSEINQEIKDGMDLVLVKTMDDVLNQSLEHVNK
jgi:ATP-dependent Lon protease